MHNASAVLGVKCLLTYGASPTISAVHSGEPGVNPSYVKPRVTVVPSKVVPSARLMNLDTWS